MGYSSCICGLGHNIVSRLRTRSVPRTFKSNNLKTLKIVLKPRFSSPGYNTPASGATGIFFIVGAD